MLPWILILIHNVLVPCQSSIQVLGRVFEMVWIAGMRVSAAYAGHFLACSFGMFLLGNRGWSLGFV
jgi:hypothetical protein